MGEFTNDEAVLVAESIEHLGGAVHDTICRGCGNLTVVTLPYRPRRARKDHYMRLCMCCDSMNLWPRMELV